jgi:hypothetical protein
VKETPESGVCWPGSQPGGFRAALDPVRRGLNYRAGEWFRLAAAAVDSLIRHGRGASLAPRSILSTAPLHHAGTLAKLDHLIRVHLHGPSKAPRAIGREAARASSSSWPPRSLTTLKLSSSSINAASYVVYWRVPNRQSRSFWHKMVHGPCRGEGMPTSSLPWRCGWRR